MPIAAALASLLVLLSVALTAKPARACSCAFEFETRALLPRPNQIDVPTNTRVTVLRPPERSFAVNLIAPDGTSIPLTRTNRFRLGPDLVEVAAPPSDLAPNTTYGVDVVGNGEPDFMFTTGAAPDDSPPPEPKLGLAEYTEEGGGLFGGMSSCGESKIWTLPVRFDPLDGTVLLLTEVDGSISSPTAPGDNALAEFRSVAEGRREASVTVGQFACNAGLAAKEGARIRVALLDMSGQLSGWSGARTLDDGCNGGGDGATAASLGLSLLALAAVRRRRPQPPQQAS